MERGIAVLQKYPGQARAVILAAVDPSNPEAGALNELDMDTITEVIDELMALINSGNPEDYYEWGVDLFAVCSEARMSSCHNDIEGMALTAVPTRSLLDLMIAIRDFKRQYRDFAALANITGAAFTQIKTSPSRYKMPHSSYYRTMIDGVTISLFLTEEDLNREVGDFLEELQTNGE